MSAPGPRPPRRVLAPAGLAALALAVLAAHLLLLIGLPQWTVRPAAPPPVRPLLTRTLPAPPPPSAPVAALPKPAPPAARPRPARPRPAPARPAQPAAAPEPAEMAVTAEPVPAPLSDTEVGPALAQAPAVPEASAAQAPDAGASAPASSEPPTTVGPAIVPGSARLSYKVQAEARQLPYHASAELLWRHDATQYEAHLTISAFLIGSRSQSSVGSLTPQGLAPTRFADRPRRGEQAAHFDHAQGRITFSTNTPEARLLPGAQDRLSLFLQLGALIAGQPGRFPPGSQLTIQTAGTRDAEPWVLSVEREETLALAGQALPTLKLLRQPRREYDTRIELWLGRTLDYLPVRIRITQANGDFVDQQLSAIERP